MTDFQDLKDRLDLIAELEKDLGQGHKSGKWVMFSCPFPGHKHGDKRPSLAATPDNGRYYCFTCGQTGDVITWLRDYKGMSWKDIKDLAGGDSLPPARPRPAQPDPDLSGPPSPAWQARAGKFIDYCVAQLWGDPGSNDKFIDGLSPLEYLRQRRGLQDDVIRYYCLGYNPKNLNDDPTTWGFDLAAWTKDHDDKPRPDKLFIDRGIVIPWLTNSGRVTWAVNIRRPADKPKYRKIEGSQSALFGADNLAGAEFVLMTEGEFDAILADQLLWDVAGVATLGSASKQLDVTTWGVYLLPARAILAAYDLDPAGKAGVAALMGKSDRMHLARVPVLRAGDKDITDYVKAGGDLWEWLKYNLDRLGLLAGLENMRVSIEGQAPPNDYTIKAEVDR